MSQEIFVQEINKKEAAEMLESLKRFIEKIAEANKKEFKGQNPDCCTINRPDQTNRPAGEKQDK